MYVLGIDLGNKTRTALVLLLDTKLIEWSHFNYNESESAWHHRQKIVQKIKFYIDKYNLTKNDYILFEQIFFSKGLSKMSNITSMAFLQATIINEFSNNISICEIHVQSWKSKVLGSRSATKEDSINFVEKHYPQINLNLIVHHKRKDDEIIKDHDTADAICIALFPQYVDKIYLNNRLVNYT